MGFLTNWLNLGSKKNKEVIVKKIKEKSIDPGAMAAASPSAAAKAINQMMAPTKVLMVQDGEYMPQVTDYALKMAGRLGSEIIALDVTEKPLQFSGERKARETERFMELAKKNAEDFTVRAKGQGIKVQHIMDIGDPEEIMAKVSADDAGIRYVLSKPEEGTLGAEQQQAHVPVFDVRCSRLQ